MAFCPKCGKQVEELDAFCEHCGFDLANYHASLETPKGPTEQSEALVLDEKELEEDHKLGSREVFAGDIERRTVKQQKSSSAVWRILGGLLALGLVLLGVYVGFYGRGLFGAPSKETTTTRTAFEAQESRKVVKLVTQAPNELSSQTTQQTTTTSMATTTEVETKTAPTITMPASAEAVGAVYQTIFSGVGGKIAYYYAPLDYQQHVAQGGVASSQADMPLRSASLIKLYILIAYEQAIEAGQLQASEVYQYQTADIVGGTGVMQAAPRNYSYGELAQLMIANSDNMAANVLINRLGGTVGINQVIKALGYSQTALNRKMLDQATLAAGVDNYVTAHDVADTLMRIYRKELVSQRASEEMLHLLGQQQDNDKLTRNLPSQAKAYHKTGQFDTYGVNNDAAIVTGTQGSYVLVTLLEGGSKDIQLSALNQFGLEIYNLFNQ